MRLTLGNRTPSPPLVSFHSLSFSVVNSCDSGVSLLKRGVGSALTSCNVLPASSNGNSSHVGVPGHRCGSRAPGWSVTSDLQLSVKRLVGQPDCVGLTTLI